MTKPSRMREHDPSMDILSSEGKGLEGKKIVLCITGSVAAYKAIDLARLLIRHGADVHAVMSSSTTSMLLSPDMMKWATGNEVVTKLTGNLEHVMLADYEMSDLVIVYPCTANTIGKMTNGIDDTPVTSVMTVALGSKIPIIIAPAMHASMYCNEFVVENIRRLKGAAVRFVDPTISEGKAKVAEPKDVLKFVFTYLDPGHLLLSGRKVLVSSGSTVEYIDPIRVLTNLSSGKMGTAIAEQAKKMGAAVTLISGRSSTQLVREESKSRATNSLPAGIKTIEAETGQQMYNAIMSELSSSKYDIAILAAAVTDFTPMSRSTQKIDTRKSKNGIQLSLSPTKKIVDEVKSTSPDTFLVAFKAEHNVTDSILVERSFRKLKDCNGDLIVANDTSRKGSEIGSEKSEVFIIDRQKNVVHLPLLHKPNVARELLSIVSSKIENRQRISSAATKVAPKKWRSGNSN